MIEARAIDIILVPQGAEHRAVLRGLKHSPYPAGLHPREEAVPSHAQREATVWPRFLGQGMGASTQSLTPQVIAIPAGIEPVQQFLQTPDTQALLHQKTIVVLGLCGSLRSHLAIGATVIYQTCRHLSQSYSLTAYPGDFISVQAITCDRVIHRVSDKHLLAQTYGVDVVDMEGTAILASLTDTAASITMLRVVSDSLSHDLPDLSHIFDPAGNLRPLPLAITLLRQPIAAFHLIRGSITALHQLETLARHIKV